MAEANYVNVEGAVALLRAGQAVVFPTDTVYGVGVSVRDAPSPEAIYAAKERSHRKPVAWLVGGVEALDVYGKIVPEDVKSLARTFWPGALTIVVVASDAVPAAFRSAQNTIGLRMPHNPTALGLIEALGCPIATSSANLAGNKPVCAAADLDAAFLAKVAGTLVDETDEGKSGVASTVVDCSTGHPVILREGAVSLDDIKALW